MKHLLRFGMWAVVCFSAVRPVQAAEAQLADALQHRAERLVRVLLDAHVDLNARQGDGSTALLWAAHWDDLATARLLIAAGADVNVANDLGVTALLLASANSSAEMGILLLKAGSNPNAVTLGGETPLMRAAKTGNVALVKALLAHNAQVNAKEPSRLQTALMWAAAERHVDVVQVLLEHGADVHARTRVRPTLVNRDTLGGGRDEKGVIVDLGGSTPLLFAARSGDVECARLLIASGASADESAPDGATPLVIAAHSGHGALAAFLLSAGADPNADGAGYTALHAAVLRGDTTLVKALLDYHADSNARLAKGTPLRRNGQDFVLPGTLVGATPLLLAAKFVEVEILRILVDHAADSTSTMPNGATLLMMAAGIDTAEDANRKGVTVIDGGQLENVDRVTETVKAVLALGGDVNARDRLGNTALHIAAGMGYNEVVQLLADHGANLSLKNKDGRTPLSLVAGGPRNGTVYGTKDLSGTEDLLRHLGATE